MGQRKAFIDRQRAETYQLIYRSTTEDDGVGEERVLVEQGAIQGALPAVPHAVGSSSTLPTKTARAEASLLLGAPPPPFSFPFGEEELTEAQKEEIKELGLPLDGYNYLRHLRTLGSGRTELQIPKPAAVFVETPEFVVPPPETRFLNAKGLTIHSAALDETEAEDTMRSDATTAFTRVVPSVRGSAIQELRDVEALFEKFEGLTVQEGDLLDSFVMDATSINAAATSTDGLKSTSKQRWIALPDDLSSEEEGALDERKSVGRSRFSRGDFDTQSSFSERWRGTDPTDFEGRKQRTRPLEIVDEMFENVLEEYDEDEMGELDDEEEDGMSLEQLARYLNTKDRLYSEAFQPEGAPQDDKKQKLPKKIGPYRLLKPRRRVAALKEKDHKVLAVTKKLATSGDIGSKREEWEDIMVSVRSDRDLDCESAWSCRTRSTLHQPSLIVSTQKSAHKPASVAADPVRISSKSGMPVGELDASDEDQNSEVAEDDMESQDMGPALHSRQRNEGADEKRLRKQAVKDAKREARLRKKETKAFYAQERTRQQKQMAGMITKNASVVKL